MLDTVDKVFRIQQDETTPSDGRPMEKPRNPQFSSGPTKKRPGYSYSNLDTITLGRSHRSDVGKAKLKLAIMESKRLLGIPEDYELGFVPASDTGAYEMAMWNMLGARPVDVFHWESFGKGWFTDVKSHLKLTDYTEYSADYGQVPDFSQYNSEHDALFTFNGTTSGVMEPPPLRRHTVSGM